MRCVHYRPPCTTAQSASLLSWPSCSTPRHPARPPQATISQESAAEEPAGPAFQLRGLGLPELGSEGEVSGGGGAPEQSADEVLAEVEAALAEAAEALERGRSPSPPAWSSLPPSRQGSVASPGEAQALGVAAASAARSAHAKLSVVL